MNKTDDDTFLTLRLDVILFRLRLYKSRGLAIDAISSGAIRLERENQIRRVKKPSLEIRTGDILIIRRGPKQMSLQVLALPQRRGPAAEAQACYELLTR